MDDHYWGKPITGFGDPNAELMIIGLAPAAHGANRTGRIFTGDRSGEWLYRALYKSGFANQAESTSRDDGLKLKNCYISCVVKCAPPGNKPSPTEIARCSKYLEREIEFMPQIKVFLALGGIALHGIWPFLQPSASSKVKKPKFAHGGLLEFAPGKHLLTSYHPSQQNTFTGRLTEPMFDAVFAKAREILG
jgi:uracil-DNA glycosylase family 4